MLIEYRSFFRLKQFSPVALLVFKAQLGCSHYRKPLQDDRRLDILNLKI